ncbi:hypothetical protein [Xanthobacter cornucopiae]|uniref:hypothetical protein n=1 Tax=Xanthobacter cornucopiae TaxID=3119924 RepID=UPI00372D5D75
MRALALAGVLVAAASLPARALDPALAPAPASAPAWPDSLAGRLAALALVQTLNADLLSHPSATLTLDRWCADHRLAPAGMKIVADRVKDVDKPADAAVREALQVGREEKVAYRRVRLRCGDRVLSEADNWYVPALLTDDMNRILDTTDTPFGRVVQPLSARRRTLSAELLWRPLPQGWEMGATLPPASGAPLAPPSHVLQHRAVLALPDGRPFSALVETYTGEVLGFPWIAGR